MDVDQLFYSTTKSAASGTTQPASAGAWGLQLQQLQQLQLPLSPTELGVTATLEQQALLVQEGSKQPCSLDTSAFMEDEVTEAVSSTQEDSVEASSPASDHSCSSSSHGDHDHDHDHDHSLDGVDSEWDRELFEMSRKDFVRYCTLHKDELGKEALARLRKARRRYKNRGYQQAARTRHSLEHAADKKQSHAKLQAHANRLAKHCHKLEQERDEVLRLLQKYCPQHLQQLSFPPSLP
eukprot:m.117680 g.117680  ORF g.117680 m.117680 type:complete len:237 (+) comp13632_c0_seq1:1167-1877(+)